MCTAPNIFMPLWTKLVGKMQWQRSPHPKPGGKKTVVRRNKEEDLAFDTQKKWAPRDN